jgi:hypothetical protein
MIGGMVGTIRLVPHRCYGVTRDKIVEIKAVLSDGSSAIFKEITSAEFIEKQREHARKFDLQVHL